MQNWLLQSLSDVLNQETQTEFNAGRVENDVDVIETSSSKVSQRYHSEKSRLAKLKAEAEWSSAIASVEKLLLCEIESDSQACLSNDTDPQINLGVASSLKQGLIFSAPVPLLSHHKIISSFQSAVFSPDAFNANVLMPCRQSLAEEDELIHRAIAPTIKLPLIPQDPIAQEQFCLVLTANFGLVMVLGEDSRGVAKFHFSFDPVTIEAAWATLRSRLVITNYSYLEQLDSLVDRFAPTEPSYRLVTSFSRQLIDRLQDLDILATAKNRHRETIPSVESEGITPAFAIKEATSKVEMELLQALTHEIRTPLTTIRTLTKLLLKRQQDFKPNVVKRLQTIDRECTEQIERMELIFRAAELESTSKTKSVELVPFPLEQVFQQSIPRWQEKAQRRNVDLKFVLPQTLPKIVSDPEMLDTVLTGLMESCTRSLPTGGNIDVKVSTAGNQLKLQVLSQASNIDNPFKSLGQLLSFQPATGCLSLNLDVTKNIFQALGGKFTVRQRQEQGKELTIFLPLGSQKNAASYPNVAHS